MLFILPVVKFLLRCVSPNIPDLVIAVANLKRRRDEEQGRGDAPEERVAEVETAVARQLVFIETLATQVAAFQTMLRWTLFIGLVALSLALTGLAVMMFT